MPLKRAFFGVIKRQPLSCTHSSMTNPHHYSDARPIDFWLARGAILIIVGLQLGLVNDLWVGPRWLAPTIELTLLVPLSIATAWTQKKARKASTDSQWDLLVRGKRIVRRLAIVLTFVITLMNFGALAQLILAILAGHAGAGRTLLLDAVNIWTTNVVIFALWFWTIDRRNPTAHGLLPEDKADFLFAQYQPPAGPTQLERWIPGFVDYLFLAFTNATAFSPADTFPLTARAKLLMMVEAAISFITIAVVASRAIGILN
jgi:hypothetical protein